MSLSKYWKCSGCGSIHIKNDDSSIVDLIAAGLEVSGGETCSDCQTRHNVADIYQGKYDPSESEDTIDKMLADPGNAVWDSNTKTWSYKG